jgi:hypothetical protein
MPSGRPLVQYQVLHPATRNGRWVAPCRETAPGTGCRLVSEHPRHTSASSRSLR